MNALSGLMRHQYWQEKDTIGAIARFKLGSAFAKKADAVSDKLLNQGYILVSEMLISPEDSGAKIAYENLKESFRIIEYGDGFVQQLDTAYKVFSR